MHVMHVACMLSARIGIIALVPMRRQMSHLCVSPICMKSTDNYSHLAIGGFSCVSWCFWLRCVDRNTHITMHQTK